MLELVLAAEQAQDPEWAALLYMEALGIVENELLIRTDGFHGGSFEDDWIARRGSSGHSPCRSGFTP